MSGPAGSVSVEVDGKAAWLRLDNPGKRNALDWSMIEGIGSAVREMESNSDLRALFLAGEGEHFCAGADVNWMRDAAGLSPEENESQAMAFANALLGLSRLPFPVVAIVRGSCFGGGGGLCCAADVSLAGSDARVCFSEARLGLTPATISPYVAAAVGARQARRLFITGEVLDAGEALRLGIFHEVHEADALQNAAANLLDRLCAIAPGTVAANRELLDTVSGRQAGPELAAETARILARRRLTDEAREGLSAFLEKRRPSWHAD